MRVTIPRMETYAHAFFTWALAKHGVKMGRAGGIAGAVGSVLPDIPAFSATAYYIGPAFFSEGWGAMSSDETLDAIYFTGPFGATGSALHSLVLPTLLLGVYFALRMGGMNHRRILLWFLLSWAGHTVVDFLTHVNGTRPLFWPISGWEWSSPVSYYNPRYYGTQFFLLSRGAIVAIVGLLTVRRVYLRFGKKSKSD